MVKFLGEPKDQYDPEHLQAALWNLGREVDHQRREMAQLREELAKRSSHEPVAV